MKQLLADLRRRWEAASPPARAALFAAALVLLGTAIALPLVLAHASGRQAAPVPAPTVSTPPSRRPAPPSGVRPSGPARTTTSGANSGYHLSGRLLAVKIDNVGSAQYEQEGLNSADIVYAIQVEGGLSRYLAIFDSATAPARVGPVRSARQSDIPILAAYGRVGLAYSGAISGLLPDLARANLRTVTPDSGLFSHGGTMPTYIRPAEVFTAFPGLAPARYVGFSYGSAPSGGTPVTGFAERMPAASFGFTASGSSWLVTVDGHPAETLDQGRLAAANVIVQHVAVLPGKYTDHNAGHPDNEVFSQTTGQGAAEFYRDGRVWYGRWSKATDTSPTSYTTASGPMLLRPGPTWVVLVS